MAADEQTNGSTPAFRNYDDWFKLRCVEHEAAHLIPYIKKESRIIDVGCGIGSITLDLARRVPDGYVLGVDFSEDSVKIARSEAQAQGLTNVEFIQGDAMNLPSTIPSESFDISHSHQVLIHLSNPIAALKSILRVIKPGGIIASRDNFSHTIYPSIPTVEQNWELFAKFSKERGADHLAGLKNQVWMHEAGIPWERIAMGTATWETSGERRRALAVSMKSSMYVTYGKEPDLEWLEAFQRDLSEWAEKEEGRIVGVDGWVIGVK